MSVLGWILAVVGVVGVIFALRMKSRMKKMQSVPFKKPSEISFGGASVADPKGGISTEGKIVVGEAPLIAPMSGKPCLAYKITVERKWEKDEETENGTKTKSGKDELHRKYEGASFQLSDGEGAIGIDLTHEPDADFVESHSSTVKVGMMMPGSLAFGQLQLNTPAVPRDSRTVSFVGTEKILKAEGTLYAMGALSGDHIGKPSGMLGSLLLSSKGREALMGSTQRNMKLGFGIGGSLAFVGTLLGLFGPAPTLSASARAQACTALAGAATCSDKITAVSGSNITWTVPADGVYHVAVHQPNVKRPIDAVLTVTDSSGATVAHNDDAAPGSTDALVEQPFKAGTYTLNVKDALARTVKGGYSYSVEITDVTPAAPVAAAIAEPAAEPAPRKNKGRSKHH